MNATVDKQVDEAGKPLELAMRTHTRRRPPDGGAARSWMRDGRYARAGSTSGSRFTCGSQPSRFGSHQLRSPSSFIVAGSSTPRMIVASSRTANASPTPIFEIDPFELKRRSHPGSKDPAPPASQRFWVAHGSEALRWKIREGDYRLVVMNADGSRGVDAEAEFKLTLPHVAGIAWTLIVTGLLLVLGGIAAVVVAIRRLSAA
jgi:hypothetical protein